MLALASRLALTHRLFKVQPQHNHSIASTFEKPRHNSEGTIISVTLSNNISSSANGRANGSDGGGGDSLVVCSKIPQYQSHVFFRAGCLDSTYLLLLLLFCGELSVWLLGKRIMKGSHWILCSVCYVLVGKWFFFVGFFLIVFVFVRAFSHVSDWV